MFYWVLNAGFWWRASRSKPAIYTYILPESPTWWGLPQPLGLKNLSILDVLKILVTFRGPLKSRLVILGVLTCHQKGNLYIYICVFGIPCHFQRIPQLCNITAKFLKFCDIQRVSHNFKHLASIQHGYWLGNPLQVFGNRNYTKMYLGFPFKILTEK